MSKASVWPCSGTVSLAALLNLALPAMPAAAQGLAVYARTPTGLPETMFDTDPADAADLVADQCLANGLSLVTKGDAAVTCQVPDDRDTGARADLGQAGRSGRPIFYRFTIEERGGATRILAGGWEEAPGFWGGKEQRELDDPAFHNAQIDLMVKAGGRLPPGTRFSNHAMIGASFVSRDRPAQALEVTEVEGDGPAMRAGLQPGDLVMRIANLRTRTLEDLNRSLVEAAGAARFEIRFLRDGREGVALLRSEFRQAVTAPAPAAAEDTVEAGPAAELAAASPQVTAVATMPMAPPPGAVPATAMPIIAPAGYGTVPYANRVLASSGMPLLHAARQPYGGVPYALAQGAILPPPAAPAASAAIPAPIATASDFSVADELAKFAILLKDGVITQAEFDAQKTRLLAQ